METMSLRINKWAWSHHVELPMSACSKPSSGRSSSRQPHKPAQRESGGEKLLTRSEISKSTAQPPKQSSKAERELLELKRENATLKKELAEIRAVHDQLLHESATESFSERRVCLLKSQVVQLERQVLLLTQAVASRSQLLQDLHSMLDALLEDIKSVPSPQVGSIVDTAKSMQGRITKCKQACSTESLAQPLLFLNSFVEAKRRPFSDGEEVKPVTLIDVCSGSSEHINLKHVSRLESKLALLYQSLLELQASLQTTPTSGPQTTPSTSLLQPVVTHQCNHVTESCKLIGECCHDLLCLSLLIPAANWPPLKGNEVSLELKADTILGRLPAGIRQRKEVKEVIEAASKSYCYQYHMAALKCKALQQELDFHKSVYQLQVSYVSSLFDAVRKGYERFELSSQDLIITPLKDVLECYRTLSSSASDESLKNFLQSFKEHSSQLQSAVECMATTEKGGAAALSVFGESFFQSLQELESQCALQQSPPFSQVRDT